MSEMLTFQIFTYRVIVVIQMEYITVLSLLLHTQH